MVTTVLGIKTDALNHAPPREFVLAGSHMGMKKVTGCLREEQADNASSLPVTSQTHRRNKTDKTEKQTATHKNRDNDT